MVWWIQVLEIAGDNNIGVGRYRLTATSDEDGGGPYGLCDHEHLNEEDAYNCEEAKSKSKQYF